MTYRVVYTEPFLADIENHVDYLLGQGVSVESITRWYDKLFERLDKLDEMPKRLPVDEVLSELNGQETRKLNYGDYLAFYRVVEADQRVDLLHFQHGARERERYATREPEQEQEADLEPDQEMER